MWSLQNIWFISMETVKNLLWKFLGLDAIWYLLGIPNTQYRVHVFTGDRIGTGTEANLYMILSDINSTMTDSIPSNDTFQYDRLKRTSKTFDIKENLGLQGPIVKVDMWRCYFKIASLWGKITSILFNVKWETGQDAWFVDRIEVEEIIPQRTWKRQKNLSDLIKPSERDRKLPEIQKFAKYPRSKTGGKIWVFPIGRWLPEHKLYSIYVFDTFLPQEQPGDSYFRKKELQEKKQRYNYEQVEGRPVQIQELPSDENFSEAYYWDFVSHKIKLLAKTKLAEWTVSKWKSLDDLSKVYSNYLGEPKCMSIWKEDWWFGAQRLQGVNPVVIKLCKAIPDNFDVTEDTVKDLLEDMTLEEALEKNKIFICDLVILDGLECKDNREIASPMALFYLNKNNKLMPVAIQLKQKAGPDNPVYTPKDEPNTWLVAKMFYNNAEAQHHQALTHLGFTHLLMEGVVICTHRNLSPSHPLFKLMAPHFLFLLAINSRGREKLLNPGGWVDDNMTQGVQGIFGLIKRGFDNWRFDRDGLVPKEIESRGVLDKEILPYYPYRDDGIPLYNVIRKFVSTTVEYFYDNPDNVGEDWELKSWRDELVKPRDQNGVGLQNIPGDSEKGFTSVDQITDVVTSIISTCSMGHAAANSQQYEQYGFVPNYPAILHMDVPKEKRSYTEKDIMTMLPDKRMTLDIMVITKLLSNYGTKKLGDFEIQYLYDPVGVYTVEVFQKDLAELSEETKLRNEDRAWKYESLDPSVVPNSISV